jgi:hypothetical protein
MLTSPVWSASAIEAHMALRDGIAFVLRKATTVDEVCSGLQAVLYPEPGHYQRLADEMVNKALDDIAYWVNEPGGAMKFLLQDYDASDLR